LVSNPRCSGRKSLFASLICTRQQSSSHLCIRTRCFSWEIFASQHLNSWHLHLPPVWQWLTPRCDNPVSASATFQLRRWRTAAVLPESGDRPCEEENADPGVVARQDCLVGREHHCAKGLLGWSATG
jgi:hypothetical protein